MDFFIKINSILGFILIVPDLSLELARDYSFDFTLLLLF